MRSVSAFAHSKPGGIAARAMGLGSFKINIRSGAWADFATDARGHGAISLLSYIARVPHYLACFRGGMAHWVEAWSTSETHRSPQVCPWLRTASPNVENLDAELSACETLHTPC